MMRAQLSLMDDRPDDCPPWYNALYATMIVARYGGDDCLAPVCGSLADGKDRPMRQGEYCECEDGWTGINCNVCTTNKACNALMPKPDDGEERSGGVCYQNGEVVKENYQMCDVTNKKIVDILDGRRPQVTFTCNAEHETCDFQFWVEQQESFYCTLDTCSSSAQNDVGQNSTSYKCDNVQCKCIPDRMLCGENGSVDITDFLDQSIKGPASFSCLQESQGANNCEFKEPQMDLLIQQMFGDKSIFIDCQAGECLYETEVPGFERPVKRINTPLIAGVIAGASLFVVGVILLVWYLSRRQFKYGPIHLDDSDDESSKLMSDHKPASLFFENVSYHLNGKQILSGVQGVAHPGEIMAIMGASGAGKTTFLDILARKNKRGVTHGDFYVNGEKVDDTEYKNVVGFVDQEDTMLSTLTVHETIMTSALLRLPRDMGRAAKEQRVYEVEKQLGISAIKDSLIGSEEGKGRGISGGEKRRVGIACELVTSPSILFLDEPTSGLDAYNAFNVIECLVTLAKTYKRTVIFTIHQPRSNIVALFDRLLLLAKGKTVYSGEFGQCQDYFEHIGYSCPPGFNIADYLVDLTMHVGAPHTPIDEGIDGLNTGGNSSAGPSSTRAVKSIASISGGSINDELASSPGDSLLRPKSKRRDSVKAKQERELYTRKKTGHETPGSQPDDTPVDPSANPQQWVRLSKQQANHVPQQILDDPDSLPPAASATGTDLDILVSAYAQSDIAGNIHEDIHAAIASAQQANGVMNGHSSEDRSSHTGAMGRGYARIGYTRQFIILSGRTWKNLYRNPMLMLTHYAIAILLAVLSGFLFYGLTDDIPGFQNRLGLFFFVLALFGFSTLSSLTVFATERLLFVRERANGYYSPITYFLAKVIFDIVPLRIIPPIIMGSIIYPMTGLVPDAPHFFKFILVLVLFNLAAAGICLFIGIVCKDGGVASLIGSLVMLFSLLFAGLLLNHDAIPKSAVWLQAISIFHYGFEALIVNEVTFLMLEDHKYGIDIKIPGATILSSFGFDTQALWPDVLSLGCFAAAFIVLAYVAMHVLLVERR
ncbi:ABC transporter G family member protein [Lachnellula arida]|uniref:ABC transporter G family member protein n=1 Tax=Lachnellula arida TaxID=1316785 RepID=A0A8T9BJD2_9HELO|nr:ABC transporter G family member protein [Lachnellula arida]